ncbi:NADH dehydrogenase [ubiquinone] flavoprotein 3, mitochondrial isoform X2 [Choloepus didactylus]|uniref:NADH dehydrogenase [ubiquinone] flavoprotein 3, mitochondrial isoform X2 n=1 Tax=Choloepus didactylus TaxID=27675 RepID=UPI00189E5333|nr:NADH dehydrogenase [ubiquinone] flavoprotein 3, mitochondrial isoform X2 [Choloepus didactylus]
MAASLLLRQGRAGVLKILLPEAPALRGLSSTCFLSTESGKSEKGVASNPKKQSSPKNVVEAKERGKLLPTQTAAELSKKLPWRSSDPPVVNKAGTAASPSPNDDMLSTDKGVLKFVSRKTLVEFPQKASSPFRKQDSETLQKNRKMTDGSSSSSSLSSSSDEESDEEDGTSEVGPRVASKAKGGLPKSEASPSFEIRTPKAVASEKEKSWSPKPHMSCTYPEKPHQPSKRGRKGAQLETAVPRSEIGKDFLKQNVEEKQLPKVVRLNKRDKESHKPVEVKNLSDHAESGLSTQRSGHPAPTVLTEKTRAGKQRQAAPETREYLEKQVPEPKRQVASPLLRKENLGTQVEVGKSKGASQTKEEILGDQLPAGNLEMVPVKDKDLLDEKIPVPSLEEKSEVTQDSAAEVGDQVGIQEAAAPAEPFDNSTYKNLQHHEYSTYTFLDLNLNLSKFRMPQPSSGRESPQH